MLNSFLVAAGGAIGSVVRYWVSACIYRYFGDSFPIGTLLINISGSFVIGFFATLTGPDGRWLVGPSGRVFFMVGACGGYTTFSTFSLETLKLARDGEWFYAGLNSVLSLALCMVGVWFGHVLATALNSGKGN